MPPKRPLKRRGDEEDRSSGRGHKREKAGSKRREATYETYDEALDGGVEMEEKGERYRDGDKAQRFYERAVELYAKALSFSQTYDAAYNQARALYTLSTRFLLPPTSIETLQKSIELYRLATTLTNSPLLRMDVGFNLSEACSSLADLVDDLDGESKVEQVRTLRIEARDVLQDVMDGQEEYLRATGEKGEDAQVDDIEGDAAGEGMEVDAGEEGQEKDDDDDDRDHDDHDGASATFETHLPTPSTYIDTVLSLLSLHLSLWESATPTQTPSEAEQTAVRTILDRAAAFAPPGRQAELDLAEIRVLVSMDTLVWELFKSSAQPNMGLEKSVEGAVAALGAVLASLETTPAEDESVRADLLVTLSETHTTIAGRMMFLNPQLPAGPSPLAQAAWFHLSQATSHLTTALELPTTASTPREFKPSVLLALSKASLGRARLAEVNDTAKRNVGQLFENAATYAARAAEGMGWKFLRLDQAAAPIQTPSISLSSSLSLAGGGGETPYQAGWESELLSRSIILQQLRVCLYATHAPFDTLLPDDQREKHVIGLKGIVEKATRLKDGSGQNRAVGMEDVQRMLGEVEDDEGLVREEEKGWWSHLMG